MADRHVIIYTRSDNSFSEQAQREACEKFLDARGLAPTMFIHDKQPGGEDFREGMSRLLGLISAPTVERHIVVAQKPMILDRIVHRFTKIYGELSKVATVYFTDVPDAVAQSDYLDYYLRVMGALDDFERVDLHRARYTRTHFLHPVPPPTGVITVELPEAVSRGGAGRRLSAKKRTSE